MSLASKFGAGNAAELTAPSRNDFSRAGEGTIAPRDLSYHFGSGFVTLTAPTLMWTSPTTDATPEFTVDLTSPEVGDVVALELADDSGFTTNVQPFTDTLDSAEVSALAVNFGITSQANGTYYARVKHSRGATDSAWSNTETVTIAAVAAWDREDGGVWTREDNSNWDREAA